MLETLFVTGAAGFVGRNLLREIVKRGLPYRIVALDLDFPDDLQRQCAVATFLRIDLEDADACRDAIASHSPSQVIHLAGITSKSRDSEAVARVFKSNVLATCNLLEALRDTHALASTVPVTHFLLASTGLIYGTQQSPFRETMPPLPPDMYSLSKLLAEQAVMAFARMGIVQPCVFRPAIIYGADQSGEMFIPALFSALRKQERFSMTKGTQLRDFVHVIDMVDALLFAVERHLEGTYNVGSGQPVSMHSVALLAAALSQREDLLGIGDLAFRENEVWQYALDPNHLADAGWSVRVNLDDGLRSCMEDTR